MLNNIVKWNISVLSDQLKLVPESLESHLKNQTEHFYSEIPFIPYSVKYFKIESDIFSVSRFIIIYNNLGWHDIKQRFPV